MVQNKEDCALNLLPILCENDTAENGYIKCEIEEKTICSKQF